ncbi:hypothetical protein Hdeb2414_s0003g00097931 [Helianthus debilis subsp. tardiflorus]
MLLWAVCFSWLVHPTTLFLLLNPCYYNRNSYRLFYRSAPNFPFSFSFSYLHSSTIPPNPKAIQNTSNFTSRRSSSISSTIHGAVTNN